MPEAMDVQPDALDATKAAQASHTAARRSAWRMPVTGAVPSAVVTRMPMAAVAVVTAAARPDL